VGVVASFGQVGANLELVFLPRKARSPRAERSSECERRIFAEC
jgi:hypothetical protein